jgi:hypothetical protein
LLTKRASSPGGACLDLNKSCSDVSFWHKADMLDALTNVLYLGKADMMRT